MMRLSFPRELLPRLQNIDAIVPSTFLLVVLELCRIDQMILLMSSNVLCLYFFPKPQLGVFYHYLKTRSDAVSLNYLYPAASLYTSIQMFFS